MKTRIIQDEPEPARPTRPETARSRRRAGRTWRPAMAHWSARHRKKAIFGWLAFVLVAFLVGNIIGPKEISDIDQFTGESRDAEKALDDAGLRPIEEVVFLQSDELTIDDPEFRAAVEDVTGRLSGLQYVENVKSPLTGDSEVSADGHAALVDFEIAGDSTEARNGSIPLSPRSPRSRRTPGPRDRAVRRRQRRQGHRRGHPGRPREGRDAVAAGHADHPHAHLRHARGRRSCRC